MDALQPFNLSITRNCGSEIMFSLQTYENSDGYDLTLEEAQKLEKLLLSTGAPKFIRLATSQEIIPVSAIKRLARKRRGYA